MSIKKSASLLTACIVFGVARGEPIFRYGKCFSGVIIRLASGWLTNHRVQLNVVDGAVIVREMRPNEVNAPLGVGHSVTIRVEDVDAHCNRAKEHGARITQEPVTHPYGERQYNADDLAGHSWTFSESVADMHPEDWGGMAEQL
jgi:hypothetical protein